MGTSLQDFFDTDLGSRVDPPEPLYSCFTQATVTRHNPYFEVFKTASERLLDDDNIALHLKTIDVPHLDQRRYNRPMASEIAVLMIGSGEESTSGNRDIVIQKRDGPLNRISDLHSSYCPLRYPMLFPYGQQGWHPNMTYVCKYSIFTLFSLTSSDKLKKITRREYYSYRLHVRLNQSTAIHRTTRLFQEFIVDAYAQIEQARLLFIRLNQDKLRADLYRGLADAAAHGADLRDIGKPTILPSTFIGGPRQMWQLYHDAMAIVRYCGKPDLFITMTCNPQWIELSDAAFPGQTAQDRPDLVVRLFKLKLHAFLHDLIDQEEFDKVVGYVYTIEFQKRSLPHAHILLILDKDYKPRIPEIVDRMVCVEIPKFNSSKQTRGC